MATTLKLIDGNGDQVATIAMIGEDDGWYSGEIVAQAFPPELNHALQQYDEVVEHQVLSLLDQALAAVDRFGLQFEEPNGVRRKAFSLHINKDNQVTFRLTPVPPPVWLSKSESA